MYGRKFVDLLELLRFWEVPIGFCSSFFSSICFTIHCYINMWEIFIFVKKVSQKFRSYLFFSTNKMKIVWKEKQSWIHQWRSFGEKNPNSVTYKTIQQQQTEQKAAHRTAAIYLLAIKKDGKIWDDKNPLHHSSLCYTF